MLSKKLAVALGTGIFALGAAGSAQAVTFNVNKADDKGSYTLRSAINAANSSNANNVRIEFDIPGAGVHTITPATPLPTITRHVEIDGYTQRDAVAATADDPAVLKVVINASNVDEALRIESDDVTVKGLNLQGARQEGVHIMGDRNVVAGNHIGTDAAGGEAVPNGLEGVRVYRGDDNLVGGPDPEDRNVISSNGFAEVLVDEGTGNTVQNNYVGTDAEGTSALGDRDGVQIESSGNTVSDNVVAGESTGLSISGDDNVLQGNKVGTDVNGTAALPNVVGVGVFQGDRNLIEGNLVSGNEGNGVQLKPIGLDRAQVNVVTGNLIGTTAAGNAALPNGGSGVSITTSGSNTIGGTGADERNVIAANAGDGVSLVEADNTKILGNSIGTDATGEFDLGNGGSGVEIDGENNRVGDLSDGANTIVHNDEDGVTVSGGTDNSVTGNSIHANRKLAIDLDANGTTANDLDDLDGGANDRQNGPEIASASLADGVEWSLDSESKTKYRLEFYANDTCSPASVTEAQTFLGSRTITTDVNGGAHDSWALSLPAGAGQYIAMTATRMDRVLTGLFPATFGLEQRSTSEVSPCEEIA